MRRIGHLVGIDADEAALDPPPQPRARLAGATGSPDRRRRHRAAAARASDRNASDRQACISTISDWLSCAAMPAASPTGWRRMPAGRPRSYSAWPVSCSTAEHAWREIRLVIARRDAHIRGRAAGERMRRAVEPSMIVIEPDPRADSRRHSASCVAAGKGPADAPGAPRRLALLGLAAGRARRKLRSRRRPARRRRRRCRAGTRPSARRTATGPAPGPAPAPPRAPAARTVVQDAGARWRNPTSRARLPPDLLAGRVGARLRLHQIAGQGGRTGMRVAHQPQIGGRHGSASGGAASASARSSVTSGAVSIACATPASTAS